jgi:glycosyltransferase 2 family protein
MIPKRSIIRITFLNYYIKVKPIISNKYFRGTIGLLIAVLSFYFALRDVTLAEIKSSFERADLGYVGWAFLSTMGIILARVIRWKMLMGEVGVGITPLKTLMALLAGQALNLIYPARIGDISRAYFVDQSGSNRVFMLGTVVLEKLFDSLIYVLLFVLLVLILPLPSWISSSGYTFAILTILSLGMVIVFTYRLEWLSNFILRFSNPLPIRMRDRFQGWIISGFKSLSILKNRRSLFQLFFLSIVIWVIPIFTNHFALLALQIRLPLTASLLTMIVLQASVAIPSVPGRIGLFEYLCVLSLSIFGVSEAPAFTYGVLLHVIALLPSTLVGILFLWLLGTNGQGNRRVRTIALDEQSD